MLFYKVWHIVSINFSDLCEYWKWYRCIHKQLVGHLELVN